MRNWTGRDLLLGDRCHQVGCPVHHWMSEVGLETGDVLEVGHEHHVPIVRVALDVESDRVLDDGGNGPLSAASESRAATSVPG